jgi:hypothetical protein
MEKIKADKGLIQDLGLKIWRLDSLLTTAVENKLWTLVLQIVAELFRFKQLQVFKFKQESLTK